MNKIYKIERKEYNINNFEISFWNGLIKIKITKNSYILLDFSKTTFNILVRNDNYEHYVYKNKKYHVLDKYEFISMIDNIYNIFYSIHKEYSYILDSEYDYRYFQDSAIKSRENMKNDIKTFLNKN